jgi:hypothetical protein
MDKRSSLLQKFVTYGLKKVITFSPERFFKSFLEIEIYKGKTLMEENQLDGSTYPG